MKSFFLFTAVLVLASFLADRKRTLKALRISARRFFNILPDFLVMLILVSFVLYLVPGRVIAKYLGASNKFLSTLFASLFGSVTLMPGFIAYPLCGILLKQGVPYMVLSAFSTTLMMVGVLTFPVEKKFFGAKVAIIRNLISFAIAIVVALATGIFFGELP